MSENTALAQSEDKGSKKGQSSSASLNMDELRELAELVNEHGFTDFEFENENIRVRLSKMVAAPVTQAMQPIAAAPVVAAPAPASVEGAAPAASEDEGLHIVTSPIVGTFYAASGPDKEPYVKSGSQVKAGDTLCIIEAMKLMNEIESDASGTVAKVFVENGQPVEYGQPLFGIKQ